jgi:hypothetical protein
VDGIQVEAASNLLVDGNQFVGCQQLFFEGDRTADSVKTNLVFENNMVVEDSVANPANGYTCSDFNTVSSGIPLTVLNNTIDGSLDVGEYGAPASTVIGNLFLGGGDCGGANTCDYNVFTSGTDGTHAKTCTPRLATGSLWTHQDANTNLFLSATDTCARGHGDPDDFPATDIDGLPRPLRAVDAGAQELP